jgi:hypothetical protein
VRLMPLRACVCSACSIVYRARLDKTNDVTWHLIPVDISNMAEMYAGVIIACMPSAAHTFRYHSAAYEQFLRSFTTRFFFTMSSIFGSSYAKSSQHSTTQNSDIRSQPEPDVLKSTDRKYAPYFSLNDLRPDGRRTVQDETTIERVAGSWRPDLEWNVQRMEPVAEYHGIRTGRDSDEQTVESVGYNGRAAGRESNEHMIQPVARSNGR